MSTSKKDLSPSDDERVRSFEHLLGRPKVRLSCVELKELLFGKTEMREKRPPPVLLDVREEWEHCYVRFPGSLLVPLSRLPEKLDVISREGFIIVYCHTGIRSLLACYFLSQNGYGNLRNLDGGIDAYAKLIDTRLPRYRLETGRRPPESVLLDHLRGKGGSLGNPWGEGVREGIEV